MKNHIYLIALFAVLGMTSCDSFLDVNTDPTRVSESDVTMEVLLPTIIEATSSAQQSAGLSAMLVTHQLDNVQAGYYQEFTATGAWNEIYLKVLNNEKILDKLAQDQNAPHYRGVGRILRAVNLGLATDCWENIPVEEASLGAENTIPAYNTQQEVYSIILQDLDDALGYLAIDESDKAPGNDDILYGGDLSKWIKLAHALKARYMLHTNAAASEILAEVDAGFDSNDDNFTLNYVGSTFASPWFNSIAKLYEQTISTQTYGKDFINAMNGTQYGYMDPRLPLIAEVVEGTGVYEGIASYIDETAYTVYPTVNTYYMTAEAPNHMMTYAELRFIEAEAALSSDAARAKVAYESGINAHMSLLGAHDSTITNYIAMPEVQNVTLETIMKEKLIATVFNFEAWNDMRRHKFSSDVYPYFSEPDFQGRSVPAQRALYPTSEQTRNAENYEKNLKAFTEPMWKDQ